MAETLAFRPKLKGIPGCFNPLAMLNCVILRVDIGSLGGLLD